MKWSVSSTKLNNPPHGGFFIFQRSLFSRKDYMQLFKSISSATASRDLRKGVELAVLKQVGAKNQARYKFS